MSDTAHPKPWRIDRIGKWCDVFDAGGGFIAHCSPSLAARIILLDEMEAVIRENAEGFSPGGVKTAREMRAKLEEIDNA
jgi:hypothetical protein